MKEYKVKAETTKLFSLSYNEIEVGSLRYETWFSFKAEMILGGKNYYQIEPKGFWGTTIELKQNETVLLNFKMNWNGHIIIHTRFDDKEIDFILKQKGIFKSAYVLLSQEQEELLIIQPDFKWKTFKYDYVLSTTDRFDNLGFDSILLLTVIHCVNYYMTMMSAAMG